MGISIWQVVLVLVIILILFGAGKIPRVMGDVAKGIKSFKAGMKEGENEEIEVSAEEVVADKKTKKTKTKASKKKDN
ncbi:MAG: twin-arginine translocase TatA/TatE family subunit [Pelagibacterales bacterium]|nr:twin-arginine translocase TatA/TatE family subunit [Pelagibacterales bacterium]OUU61972.1 MAG: twin-arginine translocase TatA/TatE family subunit [Alphaproteobacteria bacterium TMED62]|tara:strand:- start:7802 stop:8032 length:231 start_codon:yes stop_codon:yes gene_type:complete